jgi:hypothetical protein
MSARFRPLIRAPDRWILQHRYSLTEYTKLECWQREDQISCKLKKQQTDKSEG